MTDVSRDLTDELAGKRRFQVQTCLGRGGFGEVYKATMVSAGGVTTDVALKVLHAEVDPGSQAVQRLRDEGRLLGALNHPSVLRVYDLVLLGGRVGLVTEYVEGQDLDKCLRGAQPMSVRAAVEVIGRVAVALDAAWTTVAPGRKEPLRLVHRDVKPANIRIGRHGQVKLLDFGIARAANLDREARTETHAVLGSALYMAPERYLENDETGPPSDIYSLGCTLYEALCIERFYEGRKLRELYLLALEPERYDSYVRERIERLPRSAESLIPMLLRMLDLDPQVRPTAAEVSETLADASAHLPGLSLDRWAAGRSWPEPPNVQGILDGAVITEGSLTREVEGLTMDHALWTDSRRRTRRRVGLMALLGSVGLVGLSGVAAVALVAVGVSVWSARSVGVEAPVVVPTSGEGAQTVDARPAGEETEADVAEPEPEVVNGSAPTPVAERPQEEGAAEEAPVDATAGEEGATPVPSPAPVPRSAPLEGPEPALITVEGSLLVEFREGPRRHRAGWVPPGTWQIYADFGTGGLTRAGSLYAEPGGRMVVRCSKLRRECVVD